MDIDWQAFDPAPGAASAAAPRPVDPRPQPAPDDFGDIGYEAANPALQSPQWCAAMQGMSSEGGGP